MIVYLLIATGVTLFFKDYKESLFSLDTVAALLMGLLFPLSISIYLYYTIKHIGK